ncbi:hypothetical protein EDD21DRAFT_360295 [Dissophora ornata]|nr:Xanthine phosphoribosyltransferase 1 [Dissophora ornata]KAI8606731.1 hypothetical protein EDD21DRAFT_360295 [Dissophora ornata]
MAAAISTAPQRRHDSGFRRNLKSIVICILLLSISVNVVIYLSFDSSPPEVPEPAEAVQRRELIVPKQLRGGRRNPSLNAPPSWMNDWFQYQRLDPQLVGDLKKTVVMDLVYTWVNGTEPGLQEMKEHYKELSPFFQALAAQIDGIAKPNIAGGGRNDSDATRNRFRDMSELKYSVRSVAQYGAPDLFKKIHILTTEVEIDRATGEKRGQVPQWLDPEKSKGQVELVPHGDIYDDEDHLPSFNSLSIESQMHHVPNMADIFVYLNDDVFFGKPINIADFWTPLYGFVFHMDAYSKVQPWPPKPVERSSFVGEWESLQYTNSILAKQFGARHRVYIAHIPHILSVPILTEIQALWPEEFAKTSSHRFRGEGGAHDVQVSYMLAHYVMERFRETQLTSYWKYRLDKNQDGRLDWGERQELIRMVEHYNFVQKENQKLMPHLVNKTFTSSLEGHDKRLQSVGIQWTNETKYFLTGMDAYPFMLAYGDTSKSSKYQHIKPYLIPQLGRKCVFDLDFCLGADFKNSSISIIDASTGKGSVFERLAFTEFHCGDCLLHIARQESSTPGMSALMPLDRNSKAYREVVTDLAKYNYVIGHSEFSFVQLKNGMQAEKALDLVMQRKHLSSFFCINDDVQDNPLIIDRVRKVFSRFLNQRLPVPSPWEKLGSDAAEEEQENQP